MYCRKDKIRIGNSSEKWCKLSTEKLCCHCPCFKYFSNHRMKYSTEEVQGKRGPRYSCFKAKHCDYGVVAADWLLSLTKKGKAASHTVRKQRAQTRRLAWRGCSPQRSAPSDSSLLHSSQGPTVFQTAPSSGHQVFKHMGLRRIPRASHGPVCEMG